MAEHMVTELAKQSSKISSLYGLLALGTVTGLGYGLINIAREYVKRDFEMRKLKFYAENPQVQPRITKEDAEHYGEILGLGVQKFIKTAEVTLNQKNPDKSQQQQ